MVSHYLTLIAGVLMSFWVFVSQVIDWKIDVLVGNIPLIAIYNEQWTIYATYGSLLLCECLLLVIYGLQIEIQFCKNL